MSVCLFSLLFPPDFDGKRFSMAVWNSLYPVLVCGMFVMNDAPQIVYASENCGILSIEISFILKRLAFFTRILLLLLEELDAVHNPSFLSLLMVNGEWIQSL